MSDNSRNADSKMESEVEMRCQMLEETIIYVVQRCFVLYYIVIYKITLHSVT